MSKKKKLIQSIILLLFVAVSLCCLKGIYNVLSWKDTSGDYQSVFSQLYATDNDLIDVVFVGSSHCYCGVYPHVLWEEKGIASFDLSVSGQDKISAYHHIKELLKTQKPKVVVVDLFGVTFDEHGVEGNVYRNLMGMRTSRNSVELVTEYAPKEQWQDLIARLPIIHTRYKELEQYDFNPPAKNTYGRGACFGFDINPQVLPESVDKQFEPGELSDKNKEWLDKMIALSKTEDFELIFMVLPMVLDDETQSTFDAANDYLSSKGIKTMDFGRLHAEIGIDFSKDFVDPTHLNSSGATKVSHFFADYLSQNSNISDHRGDTDYHQWNEDLTWYHQVKQDYELKKIDYFSEYTDKLIGMKNTLAVISLEGDFLEEYDYYTPLSELGMDYEDYETGGKWIYQNGVLTKVHENDPNESEYHLDINKKDTLKISYDGDYLYPDNIMINHESFYAYGSFVTITTYDLFLQEPIETKGF